MSLSSVYTGSVDPTFIHRVQVATNRIAREILENEAHTVPFHQARAGLATRIVSSPSNADLFSNFAILVHPGDAVDQSIVTDDTALRTALWESWNAMTGVQ